MCEDKAPCEAAVAVRAMIARSLRPAMAGANCWLSLDGEGPYEAFSCDKGRFVVHLFYITIEHTYHIQQAIGYYDRIEGWLLCQQRLCPPKRCHFL